MAFCEPVGTDKKPQYLSRWKCRRESIMKKEILIADNIDNIYDEINALIREKKTNVKKVVNDAIISLNWGIGKRLSVELS